MHEAGARQFGDAAQRPTRAQERELTRVDVGWKFGQGARLFVHRVAIGANPQGDGRHDHRPRGEVPGAFHVMDLAGKVLDERRVVEGVDLRIDRIAQE